MYSDKMKRCFIKLCCYLSWIDTIHTNTPKMYDFHWGNVKYMNPSRETIRLIRLHQCDSEGGRIRGVLLYVYICMGICQKKLHIYWLFKIFEIQKGRTFSFNDILRLCTIVFNIAIRIRT